MKTLELTERHKFQDRDGEDWYVWDDTAVRPYIADMYCQAKRLTDTELAAEYWRLRLKVCASGNRDMKTKGHVCIEWQAAHDELDTMRRFMDLPHYDEPQP